MDNAILIISDISEKNMDKGRNLPLSGQLSKQIGTKSSNTLPIFSLSHDTQFLPYAQTVFRYRILGNIQ